MSSLPFIPIPASPNQEPSNNTPGVLLDTVDEPLVQDLTTQYMQVLTNEPAPDEAPSVASARSDLRTKYHECLRRYQQQLYEKARALAVEQVNARRRGLSALEGAHEAAKRQRPARSPPRRPF